MKPETRLIAVKSPVELHRSAKLKFFGVCSTFQKTLTKKSKDMAK